MSNYEKVKDFMNTFGQEVKSDPDWAGDDIADLRIELIAEELQELCEAVDQKDMAEIADALTDLLYVVYGAGAAYGIDLDATFSEVHESNMSKLGEDGSPIYREDGKVLKGPNYWAPNMNKFV
ncbi:nucleoside triphosphate pyrophosphohydrolase family protein [Pseudomonadales bacterium]|jgi:predicted HAD superfamily Cof-like phosphohydrolase|nr:nucleoside triphosphate pyrophosphohydrolase family protein [bacterium]MDB4567549.1 nucleoside triphosphate pyrophosphohydrolase family protein [Pseudomonadales bacterium]|tara:strand:- start:33 stop:401 length:369 start_codon:yes stop_codon:yes gene_type:complete